MQAYVSIAFLFRISYCVAVLCILYLLQWLMKKMSAIAIIGANLPKMLWPPILIAQGMYYHCLLGPGLQVSFYVFSYMIIDNYDVNTHYNNVDTYL